MVVVAMGTGKSLDLMEGSTFDVQRSTIARAQNLREATSWNLLHRRKPLGAKTTEDSASLRVTGVLGWVRMCQSKEINMLFDEEARYCCLREFLCLNGMI